jgi:micrococcal nuclease|tara:strand:+ start:72 stop:488 length:417 start_codon:yes stop_codon:yes gene_type:complete
MYEYNCTIDRVVDGDTVDVTIDLGFKIFHKARVRMYGIDTPESRTRDLDEKARGILSKSFLQDALVQSNKVIIKTQKDAKGKFGRILGELYVNDININQLMVDKYLAVAYTGQSKGDIIVEHLKNKQKLIELGKYKEI